MLKTSGLRLTQVNGLMILYIIVACIRKETVFMHIMKWHNSGTPAASVTRYKSILYLLLALSSGWSFVAPAQAQDLPIDIQVVGNHRLEIGETLELLLLARQPFGQVPWLFAAVQPNGSTITDNGDGTRMFSWTPQAQDIGENKLTLVAVDDTNPSIRIEEEIIITVLPANSFISRLAIIAPSNVIMTPNEPVSIRVAAVDGEGLVPDLVVLNLPPDASFVDNGDGSRSIKWTAPELVTGEGNSPFTGVFAVQASAADDPGDTVLHIISFVVTDELPPHQQPRLEPLPQIFAPPAPSVVAGELVSFRVEAFHTSGLVPDLMIDNAPPGAIFEDNGDGSREFIWKTTALDIGEYSISFIAVDAESGEANTFESTLLVLANALTVTADHIISLNAPLESLSIPGTDLEDGFDVSETEHLIDVQFLVDSVEIIINDNIKETFSLRPGSNRLVINNAESGVDYRVDVDRATEAEFEFENQIGFRAYDLDVDAKQIALATLRNVLIFTWEEQGNEYTRTADGLDQQPWSGPASAVSLSGDTLAVASTLQEGVWVYQDYGVNGWQLSAHLKPDPDIFPMGFGGQLILDDDTLVISAIYDSANSVTERQDTTKPGSGAVVVYHREADGWELQDVLKASNPDAGDLFGISLALQGDTLVVGAVGEDSAASGINSDQSNNVYAAEQITGRDIGAGAAYVFMRSNGFWDQTAYLKPSDNSVPLIGFGSALAISGDRIAVAAKEAPYLPGGQSINGQLLRTGAVYLFETLGDSWQESGIIRPTTNFTYSFGADLALQGDQLVVAADREVILYQNIDDNWRTLWSTNLLHGHVDFNAPFLIGAGVETFASSSLIFSSGR